MFMDYTVQETLYTIHGTHNQFIQEKKHYKWVPRYYLNILKK